MNATSVLRLQSLTPGGSATRTASAAGSISNNFAADLVNWSGTLLAGTSRLSLVEQGEQVRAGEPSQGSSSSFTFVIPSPGAAAVFLGGGVIALRRRRQ